MTTFGDMPPLAIPGDLTPTSKNLKTYGRIADAITKASTAAFLSTLGA